MSISSSRSPGEVNTSSKHVLHGLQQRSYLKLTRLFAVFHATQRICVYDHLLGYPLVGCKLLTTNATSRMTSCPTREARNILHPSVNRSIKPCSSRGRMHQVAAAPLLVVLWKLVSGTRDVRSTVVAIPARQSYLVLVDIVTCRS